MNVKYFAIAALSFFLVASAQAAALGGISSGTPDYKNAQIIKTIKTPYGTGTCIILPDQLILVNSDGSANEDNGLQLMMGEEQMRTAILNSKSEVEYRLPRKDPGVKIQVAYGTTSVVLYDGDAGSIRSGQYSSWLMNSAKGLCASLK